MENLPEGAKPRQAIAVPEIPSGPWEVVVLSLEAGKSMIDYDS